MSRFFGILLLSIFATVQVEARTWGNPSFLGDPGHNLNHDFGIYEEVEGYQDPDREEALLAPSPLYNPLYASFDVIVVIQKSEFQAESSVVVEKGQHMRVYVREEALNLIPQQQLQNAQYDKGSGLLFYWKTSTARPGHSTPVGHYFPQSFSSDHYSSLYNNAPMPYAIFFAGNIASHGVRGASIAKLGTAASAGCARLEPQRAEDLFQLVGMVGTGSVDLLSREGSPVLDKKGNVLTRVGYKTLIIVRP